MRSRSSRPSYRSARRLAGIVVAGALVLAACGDDDDDSADTAAPVTSATEETSAASAETTADTEPVATSETSTDGTAPAEECVVAEEETADTAETTPGDTTDETTEGTDSTEDSTEDSSATSDVEDTDPEATTDATTEDSTEASGFRQPATTPSADDPVVTVSAILEPTNLDIVTTAGAALDQVLLDNVYETLLRLGPTGEIEPGLAELPEVSADATVYTFTLQDGPTFHSGEPLTADDVVWSLEAQTATDANEADRLASIETVEATDDQTVVVTLCQPDNDFLYLMTRRGGAVLQEGSDDIASSANGTGPFVLEDGGWNQGASIALVRNDDYWGDAPAISGVTFQYFGDQNAMINAFTTGDVDILTSVTEPELLVPLRENPDYVVNEGVTNSEFTLGFNNDVEPFTDENVRRAFRQAIDKEGYRQLNEGFGTLIGGPVPPSDPWYEDLTDVVPYDPDAARAALEAAGYEDLEVTLTWPNQYPIRNAEYVASQLADVGVTVEIVPVDFPVWLEQVYANHDYDMTAVAHVEPRDIVNYANPDYYWQYDSPEVQELIAAAKVNPDPDEATEQLAEAARLISEESPVDWLILGADLTASTPDVTGYPTDNTGSRFDASSIAVAG